MVGPSACALPGVLGCDVSCIPSDRPRALYYPLRRLYVPRIDPVMENNACDGVDAQGRAQLADYGANYSVWVGPEGRLRASALLHVASSRCLVASARVAQASLISAAPVDNLVEERIVG